MYDHISLLEHQKLKPENCFPHLNIQFAKENGGGKLYGRNDLFLLVISRT